MSVSPSTIVSLALWVAILFVVIQAWRLRRRRVTIGPAAGGMMHEILNDDRRKAIEIIVQDKASYVDAEDAEEKPPGPTAG